MKKKQIFFLFIFAFLIFSSLLQAQSSEVKVKGGSLFVIDGKWGSGSSLNYAGKQKIDPGKHTFELHSLKWDNSPYFEVTFNAEANKTYIISPEEKAIVVSENGNKIPAHVKKINISNEQTKEIEIDGKKVLETRLTDVTEPNKFSELTFIVNTKPIGSTKIYSLLKVDSIRGATGKFNLSSGLVKSGGSFKLILEPGEHTLYSQASLKRMGSIVLWQTAVNIIKYKFEAGKKYEIAFSGKKDIHSAYVQEVN